MTAAADLTVRTSVTVEAARERAFEVFTSGFNRWWPRGHHIGKEDLAEAIIEPRAGGRWFERGTGGTECEWGRVLAWEPPRRILLSWHLNGDFVYVADPARASEVEVRFEPEAADRTRVTLEHRHLERHGASAEKLRQGVGSDEGWSGILRLFAAETSKG